MMAKAADKQPGAEVVAPKRAAAPEAEKKQRPASPEAEAEEKIPLASPDSKDADDSGGGMFDDSAAAGDELNKQVKQTKAIGLCGASGDDWDDDEGYYVPKLDELMEDRYLVTEIN